MDAGEDQAWEPTPCENPEDEDYVCDGCFCPFLKGSTRYHSTVDDECDYCAKCLTDELRKEHKFVEIAVTKENSPMIDFEKEGSK